MNRQELLQGCTRLAEVLRNQPDLEAVLDRLIDQDLADSLVGYLADGTPQAIETFLRDAARVDADQVAAHRRMLAEERQAPLGVDDVQAVRLHTIEDQRERAAEDAEAGFHSLERGHVASVAFAGGSGTRFFSSLDELSGAIDAPNEVLSQQAFDPREPKGVFPISPVGGLSFYDLIIASALVAGIKSGRLPWVLLLTSTVTHARTLAYLAQHDLWGFPREGWLAFEQADEPRLDEAGQLVVADDSGRLVWSGDGHGGVYRALLKQAADGLSPMDVLMNSGVEHLVMHNVDNAAARPFAPARIGFHVRERAQFTLSAVRKVDPAEQVGVLMQLAASGRMEVVEYNVIDPAIAEQRDPDTGRLVHEAGNINTNLVALEAIREDIEPTLYTGKVVQTRRGPMPTSSLEMLNQHLTRLLDPTAVRAYEVDRADFFMPTKNVSGTDSVVSTLKMMSDRFAAMLRSAGAEVDGTALCDLHPACACEPDDLAELGLGRAWRLEAGSRLYLCANQGPTPDTPMGGENLHLKEGASLIVDCARPFGTLDLKPNRELIVDAAGASRIHLGRDVVIEPGVKLRITVDPGASVRIGTARVFDRDMDVHAEAGHAIEI